MWSVACPFAVRQLVARQLVARPFVSLIATFTLALFVCGCGGGDDAGVGGSGVGGSGGSGGSAPQPGPAPLACDASVYDYVPTPADVSFTPQSEAPQGEQIVFNDWSFPDQVKSMAPDGSGAVTLFSVYRVWSLGVSRFGDRLAFSCADPLQEEHFGLTMGDAIQHTWIYDFASQSALPVACGNINDECHHFGPGDEQLYVCRRYDFTPDLQYSGYRIGRLAPHLGSFEFLTDDVAQQLDLNPQVTSDGAELWFGRVIIDAGSQTRSIQRQASSSQAPELVRADAYRPQLSPDGERYLFADANQQSKLFTAQLDGSDVRPLVDLAGTSPTWSPDGTQVAYLLWDDAVTCSHVEVVASDGSQASAPTRIRDCGQSGEFITDLAWFVRP